MSLPPDCPFCLVKQDPNAIILLEHDLCIFSRLKTPDIPGCGVIIPKRHAETPFDLDALEWAETHKILIKAKEILDHELKPDGYNVGWNCYALGGQTIPHAHLHVIPRFSGEPLHAGKGIRHWYKEQYGRGVVAELKGRSRL